jgi:hypothetical protein
MGRRRRPEALAPDTNGGDADVIEKTKIWVIFSTSRLDHRGAWDAEDIQQKVMSNEEMLDQIAQVCEDVEFIGPVNLIDEERLDQVRRAHYGTTAEERTFQAETHSIARERAETTLESIKTSPEVAGVLIFGPPSEELIQTGLPIVAVFPMWGMWMAGFDFQGYKGRKVVTSCLPVVRDADPTVFAERVEDIAAKIRIIQAIAGLKHLRILDVTDRPVLGSYENGFGDKQEYERVFLENLEAFGPETVPVPQSELFEATWKADEQEAERVAHGWIEKVVGLKGTVEPEVVKSARVYLAMKELMGRHDCQAITTEGYGVFASYVKGPIPSQGLASSQLYTEGITATSECLLNSLLTQHMGLQITGRPGFNGDYIVDPFHHIAVVGHCEGALNPYGDDSQSSYVIRNLPRWEKGEGGACVQINYPHNETVTLAQISIHDKKLAVSTGKAVPGTKFFADWDDLACRTKIAVETNTEALLASLDWQTFGVHRVVFYGDFRQEIKDLAALMGFEVIKEDG